MGKGFRTASAAATMSPMKTTVAAIALAALLTGCASSDDTAPETSPPSASEAPASTPAPDPTTAAAEPTAEAPEPEPELEPDPSAELEAAVREYSDAYFKGQGLGAWDLLSERCRAKIDQGEFVGTIAMLASLRGDTLPTMTSFEVTDLGGDTATVTYDYDRGDYGQTDQPWTLEAGGWRYDAC